MTPLPRLRSRPRLSPSHLLAAALGLAAAASARADGRGGIGFQVVKPGQSIQRAIDRASPGGWVFVLPGVYRETGDATNGLNITKGLNLVGLSTPRRRVVLENSGGQSNGIAVVPAAHTDCRKCHSNLAPPFDLWPGAKASSTTPAPAIKGLTVSGITIKDFVNNGLFTRNVDGFAIVDVHSQGNKNYGIFPVSSRNGLITRSSAVGSDDSGIWVETSQNVRVTHNLVEGNVNGFEISNSEDVLLAYNEVRGNTIGIANLFLPDIFSVRPDSRRITIRDNHVHDNNKPNTAREGAILSTVPPGTGILHVGPDDSVIAGNLVENNDFVGIAVADYCLVVQGSPFDCAVDPDVTPGFVADNEATANRILDNVVRNNGTNPDPTEPFAFAASDLALLTGGDHGNCYAGNLFGTAFSLLGALPACQ
ncbi:MAG TPA: right-handed parallel beta-helix repeat-containing protein [Anaeromyxobacteraceae bacterium]|nr:right-handed parallel beta-helix repeat-containing protein [Anaeromyxobacteraceae bacterium]